MPLLPQKPQKPQEELGQHHHQHSRPVCIFVPATPEEDYEDNSELASRARDNSDSRGHHRSLTPLLTRDCSPSRIVVPETPLFIQCLSDFSEPSGQIVESEPQVTESFQPRQKRKFLSALLLSSLSSSSSSSPVIYKKLPSNSQPLLFKSKRKSRLARWIQRKTQ
jgi:hypothetical protein